VPDHAAYLPWRLCRQSSTPRPLGQPCFGEIMPAWSTPPAARCLAARGRLSWSASRVGSMQLEASWTDGPGSSSRSLGADLSGASVLITKFVSQCREPGHEFRDLKDTRARTQLQGARQKCLSWLTESLHRGRLLSRARYCRSKRHRCPLCAPSQRNIYGQTIFPPRPPPPDLGTARQPAGTHWQPFLPHVL